MEFVNYLQIISSHTHEQNSIVYFSHLSLSIIMTIWIICLHHCFFRTHCGRIQSNSVGMILYCQTPLPSPHESLQVWSGRRQRSHYYDGKFPDEKEKDMKAFCHIFLYSHHVLSINAMSIILPVLNAYLLSMNFSFLLFNIVLKSETNRILTVFYPHEFLQRDL